MSEPAQTTDSAQCIPTPSASPDPLQLSQSLPLDWEQDPSCGLTRSSISLGQKSLLFSFSSSQVSLCAGVMVALNQELFVLFDVGERGSRLVLGCTQQDCGEPRAQIPEGPGYVLACVKTEQNPQPSILFWSRLPVK